MIAKIDGIPVVYVPPYAVLADLIAAPDRPARVQVLLTRHAEIFEACRNLLSEVTTQTSRTGYHKRSKPPRGSKTGWLGRQALAVSVTLTEHVAQGRSYKALSQAVAVDVDDINIHEVRRAFTLLAVNRFYTPVGRRWRAALPRPPRPAGAPADAPCAKRRPT
jgi:hypothetical protein